VEGRILVFLLVANHLPAGIGEEVVCYTPLNTVLHSLLSDIEIRCYLFPSIVLNTQLEDMLAGLPLKLQN
jgi:hypothetical protein